MKVHRLLYDKTEFAHYAASEIKHVCNAFGARYSGSENEKNYAEYIASHFEKSMDDVKVENFDVYPNAFFGCMTFAACALILSFAAYFFSALVSVMLILVAIAPYLVEFALYARMTDPLYAKKTSQNVTAVKRCEGEVKKRLYFVVHYDAGKEWRLKRLLGGTVFVVERFLNAIGVAYLFALNVARWIMVGGIGASIASGVMLYLGAAGAIFLIPWVASLFFIDKKRVYDGANDGLSACVTVGITMGVLQNVKFENTEIGVICTGSQSVGLRGAMAWCDAHKEEFGDETTFVAISILHDKEYLTAYTSELNGLVKNDPQTVDFALKAGRDAGIKIRGARSFYANTDGAIFSRNGLKCVGINAIYKHLPDYYRTRYDSSDNLSEDCLGIGYELILKMIEEYAGEYEFEFPNKEDAYKHIAMFNDDIAGEEKSSDSSNDEQ